MGKIYHTIKVKGGWSDLVWVPHGNADYGGKM